MKSKLAQQRLVSKIIKTSQNQKSKKFAIEDFMKNTNSKAKKFLIGFSRTVPFIVIIVITIILLTSKEDITVEKILNYTPNSVPLAILFLLLMFAFKSLSFVFPISLLMITSGTIFSTPMAILINTIGTAITLSVPYWIGRFSGRDFADNLTAKYQKLQTLDALQKDNDFFFSYIARVVGMLPCDAVSMYMGSIGINYPKYILGGTLGFMSRIIATTFIGSNITNPRSPAFIISCCVNILLAIVSVFAYKKALTKTQKQDNLKA